jgi:Holliday junction resolvase-like predicted endonuclease
MKKVFKKTGESEIFDPAKLCDSMVKIGASEDLAHQVCQIVDQHVQKDVTTEEIFTKTHKHLAELEPGIAGLYALERGLSALGPSGFLFEQYVAALFKEMGYHTRTNVYLDGESVQHEIDVIATKGNTVFIVEAKYRNDYKIKTHINQVMYADARLQDIRRQALKKGDTREYFVWVVTNTRFTDNAMSYVRFRDVQLMGWDYPKYINLMKIVSQKDLYPVTVLPSITKSALHSFAKHGIVLAKSLRRYSAQKLQSEFGLSDRISQKLVAEVAALTT